MSKIKQEVVFLNAGLNTDDEEKYIANGDSPYRLNVLVGTDGATGVITNIKGNSLAIDINDHKLILSNTYVTIGSFYNRLTRKCYYFVISQPYDSGGGVYKHDNRLFCYNEDQKTLDLLFIDEHNYFDLDVNYPMRDCTMLDDWLYFNPRISEPKMIDVTRAFNYTNYSKYDTTTAYIYGDKVTFNGGLFIATGAVATSQTPSTHTAKWNRIGDSYMDETRLGFSSEFDYAFNVIKMPPVGRPVLSYESDTHIKINNVRGKVFRFSYRYKYFDNSYSVYSAFSNVTLPEGNEVYNGELVNQNTEKNYIKVAVAPHSPALIKELEVVFRESAGDWKRVKIINRQEQAILDTFGTFSFGFYNNESYIIVDNISVERVQDYVPKEARSQEIINKNILAYGGCLEGFDNIPKEDIEVNLTPVLQSISFLPIIGATKHNVNVGTYIERIDEHGQTIEGVGFDLSWLPGTVIASDIFNITLDGQTEYYTVTIGDAANAGQLIDHLMYFLQGKYKRYYIDNAAVATRIDIWVAYGEYHVADISVAEFCENAGNAVELSKKQGFKTGANHPFCLFYYDENMRRWDAQVSKENTLVFGLEMQGTTVYVPMLNEYSPVLSNTSYRWTIDWEVDHLPPKGAKYWRWGYAGNSLCTNMIQYIIGTGGMVNSAYATDGVNMTKIDITPLQTLTNTVTSTWNQYPSSIITPYAFQKGDRIRLITKAVVAGAGTNLGTLVDGVYEYEILKQDEDPNFIYIQGLIANNGITASGVGVNSLVEIYSPLKSITDTKTVYHEFGDLMYILPDSVGVMTHQGQASLHNQDTALSHTAMGTFDGGDIYHIMRTPSKPLDTTTTIKGAFHESMWYSDFYDSTDYDKGKMGFETSFGERFLNIVRYSRPFFQNTMINGLSTFEEDDANNWPGFKELSDVFGDIVAIYEQGDTLKVYQERKASSILIGRTEYMDSTGKDQVMVSNAILGAIRTSPSNYSTVFPESIARNNKFIYGFDIYNGVVWRDSVNGLFPISGRYAEAGGDADYKMQTYFKLKAKALMESGIDHVDVLSVWDEEYKNLYITFKDYVVDTNCESIIFHEPSNRWISFVDFNQTPQGGFNVPLKLTYEIVRGFEAGIGFSYDEITGFDVFDIETPVNANIYPITSDLQFNITMPMPSVSCSAYIAPTNLPVVMTMGTPTVSVSFLTLSVSSVSWPTGGDAPTPLTVTVTGGTQWLIAYIPDWLYITPEIGSGFLSAGSVVDSGTELWIYPNQALYLSKSDAIIIMDYHNNYYNISATYNPDLTLNVWLAKNPLDTSAMALLGSWSGHGDILSSLIVMSFQVSIAGMGVGEDIVIMYQIIRNGVVDGSGQMAAQNNVLLSDRNFNLSSAAQQGDDITIYLSLGYAAPPIEVINTNATPSNVPMVITMGTPTVTIFEATPSGTNLVWTAAQSGFYDAIPITFTITGASTATLIYSPDWLAITRNSVDDVTYVYDGEVINFYPRTDNIGAIKTGTVVFQTPEGVIINMAVEHSATLITTIAITVDILPSKPYDGTGQNYLGLYGANGAMTIGSDQLSLAWMALSDGSLEEGQQFNGIEITIYRNNSIWFSLVDYNVYNLLEYARTITTPAVGVVGDTINVYLCRYY